MTEELIEKLDNIFEGERLTIPRDTLFAQIHKAYKEAGYVEITPEEAIHILRCLPCLNYNDWGETALALYGSLRDKIEPMAEK